MVWWDERSVGAAAGGPTPVPPPSPPLLLATVDLECPYLRDIVLDALRGRPGWRVERADGKGFEPHPLVAASDFHW